MGGARQAYPDVALVGLLHPWHRLARNTIASIAQLVEHALRKRMVVGSIPTGGCGLYPWLTELNRALASSG